MKKTISLVLILFFGMTAFAGPKYDATYRLISKSYTLNKDGSMDYHFRKELQLFSKAAFDEYGETFIWYNPEYQTLTINESYTIRKDGSKVQTPENAFNPSLPFACENCERFNGIREMVVTHTALEYDATIVLDYTIHTEQLFMKELMERVELYEDEPIDQYEVSVSVPENMRFYAILNEKGGIRTENEYTTYKWVFYKLSPTSQESYLPKDYLPYLQFTTLDGHSTYLMRMAMQNAFVSKETPFSETVEDLKTMSEGGMSLVLAIRDYVANNIHENRVPLRYMNYLVASPATVWNTNCGNAFEKNLLLQAMLKEGGFKAVIGVFYRNLMKDPESAVRVILDGKSYYVSVTEPGTLSLDNIKTQDKFISFTDEVLDMNNHSAKIKVSSSMAVKGEGSGYKVEKTIHESEVQSPIANTILPSELAVARARVEKLSGGYAQLSIADGSYGCALRAAAISPRRTTPVALTPTDEFYTYLVSLPSGAHWVTKDLLIEKSTEFGYLRIENKVVGGKMSIVRQLKINRPVIEGKKQIKQLREMLAEWNADRNLIFLYR